MTVNTNRTDVQETTQKNMPVYLRSYAFWTPGYASYAAYRAGQAEDALRQPPIPIVPSRMKRATSLMTRMAVDVVVRAAELAPFALDDCATVFGSEHGEIEIAVIQMAMMRDGDGQISPARFKNSVHNTAAGLFSIAAKNKGFTTALAAGSETFAMCLLEAMALLKTGEVKNVVVSISDEALPAPLDRFSDHHPLAISFALSTSGPGRAISLPQPSKSDAPKPKRVPAPFEHHAASSAWRLLVAMQEGQTGPLALSEAWSVTLR